MEIGSVGSSDKGVLVSQSTTPYVFLSDVLAPLKSSYLYEESKQSFKYTSAVLIKNAQQEKKYNAFREKKRQLGYTEVDLKESFGFLLFSNINTAKKLGETGILVGNSTCKTLGDPSKGVYVSQYSDCLDQHPWSNGKSGYVAIIKLTKGRVKAVSEKFTQKVTAPTKGFDCHTSSAFSAVSSDTGSFLAFQRTQCYLYEFLGDGSDETVQCPSAACLYAIVSFLYIDPKLTLVTAENKSDHRELGRCYFPWTGQLCIGFRYYSVGLRATAGALIPTELPTVVKVDRVISLSDLRRVLPKAIFQTRFSSEVFLDGLYCSLCELVSSEVEQANTLNLLLQEIKAKDVALTVPLNDSGFLILLPSSYFCDNDSASSAEEFLHGIFVFPESRVIRRDNFPSKDAHRSLRVRPEILQVLPVLSCTEGAAEETSVNPSRKLPEVVEQQWQNCPSATAPGMAACPKENANVSDRCRVPDTDRRLSPVPAWTSAAWQNFSSYLRKPDLFQIPVSKTSDVLFPGQKQEVEDIVDSVSHCVLSPEEVPTSAVNLGSEGCLSSQNSAVHSSVDGSADVRAGMKTSLQNVKLGDLLIKTGEMETDSSPSSADLPAELIVSITSAEPTVSRSVSVDAESQTKCNAFDAPGSQAAMSVGEEKDTAKKDLESTRKAHRGISKGLAPPPKACHDLEHKHKDQETKDTSQLNVGNNPSDAQTRKFGKLMKSKKVKAATVGLTSAEERRSDHGKVPMKVEVYGTRRKMERWDLKPVISKCGRVLVPHGSVDIFEETKHLRNAGQPGNDAYCERITAKSTNVADASKSAQDAETERAAASPMDEDNRRQNAPGQVAPEHGVLLQPENEIKGLSSNPQSSGNESAEATSTPECFPPETPARRMETLISKLRSVLGGKRKPDLWENVTDRSESAALCHKRGKLEADLGSLKSAVEASGVPDAAAGKVGLSTLLSVDPRFAFALGLTPRTTSNNMAEAEAAGKGAGEAKEAAVSEGRQQIVQSPLSIFPQRGRIKMLRKHQGTSTENVKEKWWIHFQSPNCLEPKELGKKEDNPDRGTAEQGGSSFPTDGLNLLADLALCANSSQLPSQPEQAQKRRLKNSRCTNADSIAEQESFLHALLRQPSAKKSLQSPPPIQNARDDELAGLIAKEHAYSLHPSTSLLLGSSSMPVRVYPLSGCTRLLYHHQTLNLALDPEDKSNHQLPERIEMQTLERRSFRHSRTFALKDGSVQVTKRWKRNYDFGLDSRFSDDPQCRTICRALHGPWNFSVKDPSDEVRLTFHLWVALFYSRPTPRFFDLDSEPSCLETGSLSTPPLQDLKNSSFAPELNVKERTDALISTLFDRTTNETPIWDQSVVLDLSKKNSHSDVASSISQVTPMETCETLSTPMELRTNTPFQCSRNVCSTETIGKVNNIKSTLDSETPSILQEHTSSHPDTAGLRSSSVSRGSNHQITPTRLLDSSDKEAPGVSEKTTNIQDVRMELDPQVSEAGNVSSSVVNNGDLFGKEKQLCAKEPEVFAMRDANEGTDCCPSEDLESRDPKGDTTSTNLSADLNDQPSQGMPAHLESSEKGPVRENNHQAPQDFRLTDVQDQQLFQHDGPDMRNEPGSKADGIRQKNCVVDEPHCEETATIMSNQTTGLIDGYILQTNRDATQDQCDKVRDGSEMNDSQVPYAGDCTQPHDPASDDVADGAKRRKEIPLISETASPQLSDTQKASCLEKAKPELSGGTTSSSLHDERCPTPTLDEEPYQCTPCSGPSSSSTSSTSDVVGGETLPTVSQKYADQTLPLSKPKMARNKKYKAGRAVKSKANPPLSVSPVRKSKDKLLSAKNHTVEYGQIQTAGEKLDFPREKPPAASAGKSSTLSLSSCRSKKCLQPSEPNTDGPGPLPQTSVEMPSCSRSLLIPANLSKSDKTQGQSTFRDPKMDNFKLAPSKISTDLKPPVLSEKRTEDLEEEHKKGQAKEGTGKRPTKSLPNADKSNSERTTRLPAGLLRQFKKRDTSGLTRIVQLLRKEPRKCSETDEKRTDAPTRPGVDDSDGGDAFCQGPAASLRCTILNSSQKSSSTFLEQMSKRCLQEDPTQASVEEECLIFSEQMKQILKRSKEQWVHVQTPDAPENVHLFRSSCALPDPEGAGVRLRPPSFVGLKITVDVSERTSHTHAKEEETGNPVEQGGASGARAGCARMDTGKAGDGRAGRKDPVGHKGFRSDGGDPKTDPGHLLNACVKQESSHRNMRLVGKSCSKAKYRFHILVTSDDPCFEETRVQLEAQGHTAVQPSEFFLAEKSSSTLLIVLRNEDIAEHICEVPYLLSLKKTPGVQFAGIDEPGDVVNQIHQELFVRGGFIMFDRAALESLRLCDVTVLSEILQELSRSGRWKWFLHYRHSRWLTEKSRLSGEAREKKNFISWCQEAGILEVLPYHECDRLSRDQPDYLACLVHLQVQNISARYPIFITEMTTNSSFGTNGILTMTLSSFLTCKTFLV